MVTFVHNLAHKNGNNYKFFFFIIRGEVIRAGNYVAMQFELSVGLFIHNYLHIIYFFWKLMNIR